MNEAIREFVRQRAVFRCEYCHLPQDHSLASNFHIEHIRARQHHGSDDLDNLALACQQCNLFKGPNQSAFDPLTGELVRLFHPRLDQWREHFKRDGAFIVGLTAHGRATVALLQMNSDDYLELRELTPPEA